MLKKITNIFFWFIFTILISAGVIITLSAFGNFHLAKFLTVQSGSMEPAIKLGSLVVVKPQEKYHVGDTITFLPEKDKGMTVTHRIVAIEYPQDTDPIFSTKGDANEDKDSDKLSKTQIIGKVLFPIPYLGHLINAIKTPVGTVFFVIVPATIYVAYEISKIKDEISKIRKSKFNTI